MSDPTLRSDGQICPKTDPAATLDVDIKKKKKNNNDHGFDFD